MIDIILVTVIVLGLVWALLAIGTEYNALEVKFDKSRKVAGAMTGHMELLSNFMMAGLAERGNLGAMKANVDIFLHLNKWLSEISDYPQFSEEFIIAHTTMATLIEKQQKKTEEVKKKPKSSPVPYLQLVPPTNEYIN